MLPLHSHCHHHAANLAVHGELRPNPSPFSLSTSLHFPTLPPFRPLLSSALRSQQRHTVGSLPFSRDSLEEDIEDDGGLFPPLPRKQNAGSILLLRSLQSDRELGDEYRAEPAGGGEDDEEREQERKRRLLEELAVIGRRRSPRFPGAIDFPSPEDGVENIVRGDDRALRQALEIRRGVAAEILKVAMRASRLSINYSNNLVSQLAEFVDLVVMEAAAMKSMPEFSHLTFNARVKSYIESSGVVPLVKWLKHNSMSYPQIGKVLCMSPRDLQLVRAAVEWLKSIHVKGEYLGRVLIKAGPFWERDMAELNEIINYLEKSGLRKDWVGFVIMRCPQILTLTMEELEKRVKFYMEMGMDEKDFGTMIFDYPKALGAFSLEEMNCKVNYLKEFGLGSADVGRLLAYKPQLIGCSIEERWKPLVKYMYYLGIRRDGMRRMLIMKPMIFCVDLETTIAPKVRFLQDIGIREEAVGGVLVKFPPILTYSLYKKIRPVVIFLMTKAGVSQKDVGKVIALEPALVGCSIAHKLDINVKYFLSLGIRAKSLGEMIADFPMLLKYNLDVLRPKYRYLRRVMVRPLQDLIEFPRFFSYSLEGRIIPRHKILVENRINFKLRYMLGGSDENFDRRVKDAVERRQRFESGGFLDDESNMPLDSLLAAPEHDHESEDMELHP